jgi:hypothetical protein
MWLGNQLINKQTPSHIYKQLNKEKHMQHYRGSSTTIRASLMDWWLFLEKKMCNPTRGEL